MNKTWTGKRGDVWTLGPDRSVRDSDGDLWRREDDHVVWSSNNGQNWECWWVEDARYQDVLRAIDALHGPETLPVVTSPPSPEPTAAVPQGETWTASDGDVWRLLDEDTATHINSSTQVLVHRDKRLRAGALPIHPVDRFHVIAWESWAREVWEHFFGEAEPSATTPKPRTYDGWSLAPGGHAMAHPKKGKWTHRGDRSECDAILAYLQGEPGPWTTGGDPTFTDSDSEMWTHGAAPGEVHWHNQMEPSCQAFRVQDGRVEYFDGHQWQRDDEPVMKAAEAIAHFWPAPKPVETPTGEGRKDDSEKNRVDLLPFDALEEVAQILSYGAKKYADRNWEKGMAWSRPFGALMRHMWAWWRGEKCDPETGRSHLAHAACCVLFLLTYELRQVGTDDRPKVSKV